MIYYQDANGIQHESYEAACIYYGADTPAQIAAEEAYYAEEEANAELDRRFNDALIYDRAHASWVLGLFAEEMPF